LSSTEPRIAWHHSLRWRLTLSFLLLLAILLAAAGTVEYSLLRGAVISSRSESMTATYQDARAVLLRAERLRKADHRPRLTLPALARALVDQLALARLAALVVGPDLQPLASAAPGSAPGPPVVPGPTAPLVSLSDLEAAADYDTRIPPTLVSAAGRTYLVMVFPVVTPAGRDLGAVEVSESAAPVLQELSTASLVIELGSLAVLLVALGTGLWITSRSLRPLRRLTETASALGRGDLARRSGLAPRGDEVGVLAQVFDEMAESVERTVRVREEAERQMRQFIADASHELRTPLTSIKGYLEVLQRGAATDPELMSRALTTMSQEAERMRRLVSDLLTLARADAGRELQLRPVELADFLEEFLDSRDRELSRRLQPGLVVLADPDALFTICQNLQANAERHGEGAAIEWSTVAMPDEAGLQCSDHGPGISPEDLPHVFERFYRAGGSRSRQEGGSGLGLAIVQALVERMGGRVTVESQPGQGARFTVWLRRARATSWSSGGS
jgi:two-component system OmpR family sensor kinase